MQFRIADTFTASLSRLPNDQQRAAKTTAFDLQTNPSQPGLGVHRLTNTRDPNFWSARVSLDLRIIFHRVGEDVVLCYVGAHDDSYRWAERRKLETHPATGAAQLVELREVVQEIAVPVYVETPVATSPKPLLFAHIPDDQLLSYGVPSEWVDEVRLANEDSVLDLAGHLPTEAAEALLELAVGKYPQPSLPAPSGVDPFDHPDALRRFRVMHNVEELAAALQYPWEQWIVFLHPEQRATVERHYNGPARVSGSAGTGKTVVALHRAAYLPGPTRPAGCSLPPSRTHWRGYCRPSWNCWSTTTPGSSAASPCNRWTRLRRTYSANGSENPNWRNGGIWRCSSAKPSNGMAIVSPHPFYRRNGIEWSMAGSWVHGRTTV